LDPLVKTMLSGDRRALARLMTYVDNRHENLMDIMKDVYVRTGRALRVGVTGPPGAGKSTLVDKLITSFRKQGKTVGVVAVDPSSPFTGGAILGDRIRMVEHAQDDGVFIRSLGSRGSHGGLSRATRDIVTLMDAFGFDVVLIETVGVGQTELDVMNVAHITSVVLVPESGDTIQTMKAGLMEIADLFIVNKADREGADRIFMELQVMVEMFSEGRDVPVLKTQAVKNIGIDEVVQAIQNLSAATRQTAVKEGLLKEEVLDLVSGEICAQVAQQSVDGGSLAALFQDLNTNHRNPYVTAGEILGRLSWK
jgi:LAO/AO transport system kinase